MIGYLSFFANNAAWQQLHDLFLLNAVIVFLYRIQTPID